MLKSFFCLDCEHSFKSSVDHDDCPQCQSKNVMDDPGDTDEWNNGHFEGDMFYRKPMNDVE